MRQGLPGVECIDAGSGLLGYVGEIEQAERVLIVDAGDFGAETGEVRVFEAIRLVEVEGRSMDVHSESVLVTLKLLKELGMLSERAGEGRAYVQVIAVQPASTGWQDRLSPELEQCLPRVLDRIAEEIRRMQCTNSGSRSR